MNVGQATFSQVQGWFIKSLVAKAERVHGECQCACCTLLDMLVYAC